MPKLYWVFAMHTMPKLMCAAFPVPAPDLVYAIARGALYPHSHALFGALSTSHMLVIRSVFVKLVPAVCLQSWCVQRLMPTVCLIIAECSALNTCGIIVIYTALAVSVSSARHTPCSQGVRPVADDVCSTFGVWCQLWFHVCQARSSLSSQGVPGVCSAWHLRRSPCSHQPALRGVLSVLIPVV